MLIRKLLWCRDGASLYKRTIGECLELNALWSRKVDNQRNKRKVGGSSLAEDVKGMMNLSTFGTRVAFYQEEHLE